MMKELGLLTALALLMASFAAMTPTQAADQHSNALAVMGTNVMAPTTGVDLNITNFANDAKEIQSNAVANSQPITSIQVVASKVQKQNIIEQAVASPPVQAQFAGSNDVANQTMATTNITASPPTEITMVAQATSGTTNQALFHTDVDVGNISATASPPTTAVVANYEAKLEVTTGPARTAQVVGTFKGNSNKAKALLV